MTNPIHSTPPAPCPVCKATLAAGSAASIGEVAAPQPGDVAICLHCTAVLRFDAGMLPQRLTAGDFADIGRDTLSDITRLLAAVRITKGTGKPT